ncbi:hypothetical protein ABK040_016586 [Willaertia magna]
MKKLHLHNYGGGISLKFSIFNKNHNNKLMNKFMKKQFTFHKLNFNQNNNKQYEINNSDELNVKKSTINNNNLTEPLFTPVEQIISSLNNNLQQQQSIVVEDNSKLPEFKFYKNSSNFSKIIKYMNDSILVKKVYFLIGPIGSGKTNLLNSTLQKVEEINLNAVSLLLDFESYFKNNNSENNFENKNLNNLNNLNKNFENNLPIDFDHFLESYFDLMILNNLLKLIDKLEGIEFTITDIVKILTERLTIGYSFIQFIKQRKDLFLIINENENLKNLFEKLFILKDNGLNTKKEDFILFFEYFTKELPYYNNYLKNTIKLSLDLLSYIETTHGRKKRSGNEVLTFFFTFCEYLANNEKFSKRVQPKLFINGLNFLDIFSNSYSYLYRKDLKQMTSLEKEEEELLFLKEGQQLKEEDKLDNRGSNLSDLIILRTIGIYLDSFIPTIIEIGNDNYFNYQMKPELKFDLNQMEYIELFEPELDESKMLFSYLFLNDKETLNNFNVIYDKVGGNLMQMNRFYEKYKLELINDLNNNNNNLNNLKEEEEDKELMEKRFARAILSFLNDEKEEFERKLHVAHLLTSIYLSKEKGLNLKLDDYRVEFIIYNVIENFMNSFGKIYHRNYEFINYAETIGFSSLINSELVYFQRHNKIIVPYYRCYYSMFAKYLEEIPYQQWGFCKRLFYKLYWKPKYGLKYVKSSLGKEEDIKDIEREDFLRKVIQP